MRSEEEIREMVNKFKRLYLNAIKHGSNSQTYFYYYDALNWVLEEDKTND